MFSLYFTIASQILSCCIFPFSTILTVVKAFIRQQPPGSHREPDMLWTSGYFSLWMFCMLHFIFYSILLQLCITCTVSFFINWNYSMYRLSSLYCFSLTFPYNDFLLSLDFKICLYIYKNTTIYIFVLMKNFAGNCESKWKLLIIPIQWAESTLYSLEWQWE